MNGRGAFSGRGLVLLVLCCFGLLACSGGDDANKVPITASTEEVRELYLEGRDLQEKLRLTDAHEVMQKVVEQDGEFAMGHLGMANTAPTNQVFFASLGRAVELADKASDGERLMILGLEAGVKGDPAKQLEHYTSLVEAFPEDERAHNLLGGYYFGIQDYTSAVTELEAATKINPDFSPAYNLLGYAYRFLVRYPEAETAFERYIELIPEEPNAYDSFAEFLMKIGRFDDSIDNYRKALEIDPDFVPSYVGIGNNYIYKGQTEAAVETFQNLYNIARNDGETRQALFWTAAAYIYAGEHQLASRALNERLNISMESGDMASVSADLNFIGTYLTELGLFADALDQFNRAVEAIEQADVPEEVKENTRRNHLYNKARLALFTGNLEGAEQHILEYLEQVNVKQVPFELRQLNELLGMIALAKRDYRSASIELEGANQQDPRVLYYLARAYHGLGDDLQARIAAEKAAHYNGLNVNFAYVREKALELLESLQAVAE